MGNIQQRISNARPLSQFPELKHTEETRTDSEIEITNRLTFLLSDLNTKRIMANKNVSAASQLDWSDYMFVCIQGFPALKDEFACLGLPGEHRYHSAFLFCQNAQKLSEEQKHQAVYNTTFKEESARLHETLQLIPTDKKIIFVYHSAGNFLLSMYFFYYGFEWLEGRVKGMIDIAGGPLRYYISAQMLVPPLYKCDFTEIMENSDKVHEFFTGFLSKLGFDLGFKNKYHTLAFLHLTQSPDYGQLFDVTRNHPQVLKFIAHGRRDSLFETPLLNEKAIYFAYQRVLDEEYEKGLIQKYYKLYGLEGKQKEKEIKNIQQRFILAIPRGQHSVHTQARNQELLRAGVQQYLCLIHE